MQIIKGGMPRPVKPEDTFLKDILIAEADLDMWFLRGAITGKQYDKLIEEVPHSDN